MLRVLELVEWQLFCSPTFRPEPRNKDDIPSERLRLSMIFAWLRMIARAGDARFNRMLWVIRQERGEARGRLHLHALIAGLPPEKPHSKRFRFQVKNSWETVGGGNNRVRTFQAAMSGESYLLKEDAWTLGANAYESKKFGSGTCELMVSESTWKMAAKRLGLPTAALVPERAAAPEKWERAQPVKSWSQRNPFAHPYDSTPYTRQRF